ncbi:MAG: solute carrier family 23 protein, partial [Fusobacteriaceae bacterium]
MTINKKTKMILGLQHVLAMFGATVLVPFLTGLNPSVALLSAGVGTLLFHLCSKGIVPVFLGSSFAFIGAISLVLKEGGIAAVKGGVISAGIVYMIMAYV